MLPGPSTRCLLCQGVLSYYTETGELGTAFSALLGSPRNTILVQRLTDRRLCVAKGTALLVDPEALDYGQSVQPQYMVVAQDLP